jgi:SAM-dependent methyltransferase
MQAYSSAFARVYNLRWNNFAQNAAPKLRAFYEATPVGRENHTLLDLCCGTGQLALDFLDHSYQVTGLDLSDGMLDYARANAAAYIVTGQARFVQGDAANFEVDEKVGLVVSTFDALNHLPDFAALKGCFRSVYPALVEGGCFIFDLNTRQGLRHWTGISVEDSPELMLVTRAIYDDESQKAFMRISGFALAGEDLYERFEETAYEVAFDLQAVREELFTTGFHRAWFAKLQDLGAPIEDPESENRIFILAEK